MKRFHVHVSVDDLDANVRFYSAMFGVPPEVLKSDYAKWMLDDPRINFAISSRGLKRRCGSSGRAGRVRVRIDRDAPASGRGEHRAARSSQRGMLLCALR